MKSSTKLQAARWRDFRFSDLAPEDVPPRLVRIVRSGRSIYYLDGKNNVFRHTQYRQGHLIDRWEIADTGFGEL